MAAGDLTCLRDYSACPAGAMRSVIMLACSVLCRAVLALSRDCACAGWSLVPGSGGLCKAPSHYDGSCPEVLDLRGAAPQACDAFVLLCLHVCFAVSCRARPHLQDKSRTCSDVEFPCVGACTQDFSQSCPAGWTLDGSGSCAAPASYSGQCPTTKSFVNLGLRLVFLFMFRSAPRHSCAVRSCRHRRQERLGVFL